MEFLFVFMIFEGASDDAMESTCGIVDGCFAIDHDLKSRELWEFWLFRLIHQ